MISESDVDFENFRMELCEFFGESENDVREKEREVSTWTRTRIKDFVKQKILEVRVRSAIIFEANAEMEDGSSDEEGYSEDEEDGGVGYTYGYMPAVYGGEQQRESPNKQSLLQQLALDPMLSDGEEEPIQREVRLEEAMQV